MKPRGQVNRQSQRQALFAPEGSPAELRSLLPRRNGGHPFRSRTASRLAIRFILIGVGGLCLSAIAAHAQIDGTWIGGTVGAPSDWNTGTNWNSVPPDTVPTGTATFAGALPTAITFSAPELTAVQTLSFNAPGYTFEVTPPPGDFRLLQIIGDGIVTSSALNFPTFNITDELHFINSSTAGPAIINVSDVSNVTFNLEDRTSQTSIAKAGTATITAGIAGSTDGETSGFVQFFGHSTGDQATINAYFGCNIEFHDESDAGSATITANNGGSIFFNDTATADQAKITVNAGGELDFSPNFNDPCCTGGTSMAGNATITNNGTLGFWEGSSADHATITSNGTIDFHDSSTAGNATINTTTPSGITSFHNMSNAGTATFPLVGESLMHFFDQSSADAASIHVDDTGSVNFHDGTTAGTAKIIAGDKGSTDDFTGGFIFFEGNSTADHAMITALGDSNIEFDDASHAGSATLIAGLPTRPIGADTNGFIFFTGTSSAENATITVNQFAELSFAPGFFGGGTATAGNANITKNGNTRFFGRSTGGNAEFITNANGVFDMSGLGTFPDGSDEGLPSVPMTAGSIAGAGTYFLGSSQLTVGSNNLSTTVSGTIQDGGEFGGVGGSLVKVGTGTLTIDGAGTYTGGTTVSGGALVVGDFANPTAALSGGGPIAVGSGGTLGGYGSVTGSVVNNGIIAAGNATPGSSAPRRPGLSLSMAICSMEAPSSSLPERASATCWRFAAAILAPAARWPSTHSWEATARPRTDWSSTATPPLQAIRRCTSPT